MNKLYVGDGGDYLNILGMSNLADELNGVGHNYLEEIKPLKGTFGRFRRYTLEWTKDLNRMSRDQMITNICLWCVAGYRHLIIPFLFWHTIRFGLFTNTRRNGATKKNDKVTHDYSIKFPDFSGPEVFSILIRSWVVYPIIIILDMETLLSSIVWLFRKKDNNILNHVAVMATQKNKYPTPVSYLARKILPRELIKRKFKAFVLGGEFPDWLYYKWEPIIERF